jgi:uncharacterized protein
MAEEPLLAKGPSLRADRVRRVLAGLGRVEGVRHALIVAPDGFLIAATLALGGDIDGLAALTATMGRELEVGASRFEQGAFDAAVFTASDGTLVLGGSPVGYLAVVASRTADIGQIRAEMKRALAAVQRVWAGGSEA